MVKYSPEPAQPGPQAGKIGVLLCNLGTPAAATAPALRDYLHQFLSDPRVIELPAAIWKPILHGIVLRRRPEQSAKKYESVWLPGGSPLAVWSEKQRVLLRGYLGQRGLDVQVGLAMRYGEPAIAAQLGQLKAAGCDRILVLPLYPQYAAATVGSVLDDVADWIKTTRVVPELRFVQHFHDHEGYLKALEQTVLAHWQTHGRPDRLLMSFHGLPQRMIDRGDPYQKQCAATAQRLAARLALPQDAWTLAFQSRFGRAKWIGPSTQDVLKQLGRAKVARVHVICPGFVSDCLETLEEINIEGRALFQSAGGGELQYIPCLNDHPMFINALADLVGRHVGGWLDAAADDRKAPQGL
ncbi:MAG: ferrochelatase [Burkholderiaceae bacterium]|nr:MAG: ferrochelatase [Burkholderiaceae bacterium]